MNTIGTLFRFTDFGESHGEAIGGVIDGMPPQVAVDYELVDSMLARRRPGTKPNTSARKESDRVRFLSGIFNGQTLGTPIAFIIENTDARSADYSRLEHAFRPNHADYTYFAKYGVRDHRGGGRASARETAARVVAGAFAMMVLRNKGISIEAATLSTAPLEARDTAGALVGCTIKGVPAGLGEPVFGKLQAMLAFAMMSINAAKGFDYGDGFAAAAMKGSESVDTFYRADDGSIRTRTNHSGGIQGGISNGEDICFRVAFKPIATLPRELATVDENGNHTTIDMRGRHDPCVAPRVLPVVEAMAAITILDALMLANSSAAL